MEVLAWISRPTTATVGLVEWSAQEERFAATASASAQAEQAIAAEFAAILALTTITVDVVETLAQQSRHAKIGSVFALAERAYVAGLASIQKQIETTVELVGSLAHRPKAASIAVVSVLLQRSMNAQVFAWISKTIETTVGSVVECVVPYATVHLEHVVPQARCAPHNKPNALARPPAFLEICCSLSALRHLQSLLPSSHAIFVDRQPPLDFEIL